MKKRITLAVLIITACLVTVALFLNGPRHELTPARRKAIVYEKYPDTDWPTLDEPRPDEWLAIFTEPGQTYDEYVRTARNRKSRRRHTIYLQRIGPMDPEAAAVLAQTAEFAAIFFDSKVTLLPATDLPDDAYARQRRQYNASAILKRMIRRVPDDALAYVGVTTADLYSGKLNFVFGLASLRNRVVICSLCRYGQPGTPEFLRRALKVTAHEIGHTFGLTHCIFYRCCMNGSNSLAETDRQPLHYCPLCHDKLRHALGFDPAHRFGKLAAFYDKVGFTQDAQLVRRRLADLPAPARTPQ